MARPRFVCLLLALITLLVYWPAGQHDFLVYDDPEYVTENRIVQSGLTVSGLNEAFTTFHASNWHPLTWISHMLDAGLFGPNPGAQHLVNVLFHAVNALLLFLLLFRMTGELWPAGLVAALFAWHPLHVESVAWIAERKDVLSTFFGLLALLAYRSYTTYKTYRTYLLCLTFFALSLLSKPMLVTLPFVMLLLDYWPLRRLHLTPDTSHLTPLLAEKWPFFLLTIGSCIVTFLAQRPEAMVNFEKLPLSARLANAPVACVNYLLKTFWPADLAVIYPLSRSLPVIQVILSVLLLVAITVGVVAVRRRSPCLLTGWLWFLGMLVPVIGLVQVGGQAMADRYTYLPLVGVFIMISYGAKDLAIRRGWNRRACGAAAAIALGACLVLTSRQLRFWRNSETLFARAVAVTAHNDLALVNLGVALEQAGKMDDAFARYAEALRINPKSAPAHNDLANLLANTGRRDEAAAHYREALILKPQARLIHENFGTLLVETGQFDDAQRHYDEAARLAPDAARPRYLMGKARLRQGQSAEAIAQFRAALRLDPHDVQSLSYLARVLAADEDPRNRNGAEAVALARRVNELTGGDQPFHLDVLAMAYAEQGRFNEAQPTIQKAIELADAAGLKEAVAAMQTRLKLYQSGQPFREKFTSAAN
jgi:protein O-mannosyl-transferase